jgi:hypothetical protein
MSTYILLPVEHLYMSTFSGEQSNTTRYLACIVMFRRVILLLWEHACAIYDVVVPAVHLKVKHSS